MTTYNLLHILLHNVIRSKRQYLGYLGATTLAIATFFAFGFFLFHPTVQNQLNSDISSTLSQLLIIGQIGVGLFAVFFVIFFHRFLLRLRGKEFGLLLTLGTAPRQLQRIIRIEGVMLAIVAFAVGLGLGFLETLALFHVIAAPLGLSSLEPHFSSGAILQGLTFFAILFSTDTYITVRRLGRLTPKSFLIDAKLGQEKVTVSWPKLVIGTVSLIISYSLALGFQNAGAGFNSATMLPIVVLISIGTYLLFAQCLVGILLWARRKTNNGINLISISRLAHRSRDFARVLTVATLLHACVLTLVGIAVAIFSHLHQMASTPSELKMYLQLFSIVLFVLLFLAFLLLLAAISTLWVKLFTQADEDRRQVVSLRRIGLSAQQLRSVLSHELAVLFFVPAVLAIIHATVAMGTFTVKIAPQNLSQQEAWLYFGSVATMYIICMSGYFLAARWSYTRVLSQ